MTRKSVLLGAAASLVILAGAATAYADSDTVQGTSGGQVTVPGVSLRVVEHDQTQEFSAYGLVTMYAECPAGTKVLAGGYQDIKRGESTIDRFKDSYPDVDTNRWVVTAYADYGQPITSHVYALCASFS